MDVGSCQCWGGQLGQGCWLPGQVAMFGGGWWGEFWLPSVTTQNQQIHSPLPDCWRWTVEVSWLPIGQSVPYSWQQPADWVERGRTFGRGPPFCHCSGPWGVSMMMEWCTLEQPQFLHHYPRGSQHGKGQPRQPATGDS